METKTVNFLGYIIVTSYLDTVVDEAVKDTLRNTWMTVEAIPDVTSPISLSFPCLHRSSTICPAASF